MEPRHGLIYQLDLGLDRAVGGEHTGDLVRDLLLSEWRVDSLDAVGYLEVEQPLLLAAAAIRLVEHALHATFAQQLDGGSECYELAHARHVDAVIVGIAHLWRR